MEENKEILQVKDLAVAFQTYRGKVKAVRNVSFALKRGQALGIVGESGCGKSTTGRTIIGLYKPTKGKIIFAGKDISQNKEMTKDIQMIFQDPYASAFLRHLYSWTVQKC